MAQPVDEGTARFIREAQQQQRLTREDEIRLAEEYRRTGSQRAADALVRAHLRDVAFMALKYRHYGIAVADLVAEGNMGLLRAVDKFDPTRGVRLSTYAAHWIRASIVSFVLRHWRIVSSRSGIVRSKTFFKLRRESARVAALYQDPEERRTELARRLELPEQTVAELLTRVEARDTFIDESPASQRAFDESLSTDETIEDSYSRRQRHQVLEGHLGDALGALDPRERFVVEKRYLADEEDQLSLADIGRHFGVSRERARQLEERAKKKLRGRLEQVYRRAEGLAA